MLPPTFGGIDICGRYKVILNTNVKPTSADQSHNSGKELAEGYRLACQHFSDDIKYMTLIDVSNAK
jgi:Na+-transporting NADH:ubiquinone oxidoreductase subunit NqrF